MEAIIINEHLFGFYFEGDTNPENEHIAMPEDNWAVSGCNALGVCCYVIHNGNKALIFDTLCSPDQARQVRNYLEQHNINKFTVAISHWHLDHIGGNIIFEDCNILSSHKTRSSLFKYKEPIEQAELWGEPPINPLHLPDITYEKEITLYYGEIEIRLINSNIHSEDSSFIYLPKYKIILAGDMLEDTCPFIVNPKDINIHIKNMTELKAMDIAAIYPNHGRSTTIKNGGYSKELIDSAQFYLEKIDKLVKSDVNCAEPCLKEFMEQYLEKGILGYWKPYETVHLGNFRRIKDCLNETVSSKQRL